MTSAAMPGIGAGNCLLPPLAERMLDDRNVGKYPLSVASTLTEVSGHRLRAFESAGLIEPQRTQGGTRLYSDSDLDLIRTIADLADKGINYAGIREVLEITLSADTDLADDELGEAEEEQG